jgi:hypothetical protein
VGPNSAEQSSDPDELEAAADQAIAACGGNAREAFNVLIVTYQFLETDLRGGTADRSARRYPATRIERHRSGHRKGAESPWPSSLTPWPNASNIYGKRDV